MNKDEYFDRIKNDLNTKINFLDDKPEENIDSTLKALWFAASGNPKSVVEVANLPLPKLSKNQIEILDRFIKQRISNTPLAHITGRQSFMGIELLSDDRALIPRKETEILGIKALELSKEISSKNKKVNIIDVCCGSGNLALALANYNSKATVLASDLSQEAVKLTRENITFLKLEKQVKVVQSDLFSTFESDEYYNQSNLIVCNPPYISSSRVGKLNKEISENEPAMAFDGGMLGFKIIQKLISDAPKFLKKWGWLAFEVGAGQGEFIESICTKSQYFNQIISIPDELGIIRVICAKKN
jgi:release factor glutamine methyltransferase